VADNEPNPTADERIFTDEALGAELFWQQHKAKILAAAAALVVAVLGITGWVIQRHSLNLESQQALALAASPEAWRAVVEKFGGTPAAGSAQILLAGALRETGGPAASSQAYQEFLDGFGDHPLVGVARLGIAQNTLASGDEKRGIEQLRALAAGGDSFTAPLALFLEGSVLLDSGNLSAARTAFQNLASQYPRSLPAQAAGSYLQQIAIVEPPPAESAAMPPPVVNSTPVVSP